MYVSIYFIFHITTLKSQCTQQYCPFNQEAFREKKRDRESSKKKLFSFENINCLFDENQVFENGGMKSLTKAI